MKISVVTISFNQARFLRQCIESVLNQKDSEIEYIVVDPGSSDGSREIILEYKNLIDQIIFEPDSGPADGLNKGFSYATGDVFYYLNSDDYAVDGVINRARHFFNTHPRVGVLYGNGIVVDEFGGCIREVRSTNPISKYRYACGAAIVLQQSTFFRASHFREVGGFNESNFTCWDGELVAKLLSAGVNFFYVNERLGAFRFYADSITGRGENRIRYLNDKCRIFRELYGRNPSFRDNVWKFILLGQQKFLAPLK